MGDRPGNSSRVRTSEDKVCRKDKCWSVKAVYILVKLPDVSGPSLGEVGRYNAQPVIGQARAVHRRTHGGDHPKAKTSVSYVFDSRFDPQAV